MPCISCNTDHNFKFCPNCGQKTDISKITIASIFNETLSTITNMDKGLLYNIKNLFIQPQKVIVDYLSGKRKEIFNPVSFLVISITLYLIAESFVDLSTGKEVAKKAQESKISEIGFEAGRFIRVHLKFFWIFTVFLLTLATKLCFRKYNFAEHLAINSFIMGQATLVGIVGFTVFKFPLIFNVFTYTIITWMIYKVFRKKHIDQDVIILTVSAVFVFILILFFFIFFIGYLRTL